MWPRGSSGARHAVVALGSALLLIATTATAAPIAAGSRVPGAEPTAAEPTAATALPTIVAIRAAHHPGFDRLVLEFDRARAPSASVARVSALIGDFSGAKVPVPGRAVIRVRIRGAQAHTDDGEPTVATDQAFALPNIMALRGAGDFEGVVTLGIGLAKSEAFHVRRLTNPARIAIDVSTSFARTSRKVYFLDKDATGGEPARRAVRRPIPKAYPATGLLDRIFAGPTIAEQASGLRLVTSGATGFASVRVSDGVARLRLTGGCRTNGSSVTIADEIMPTLRRLSDVSWIKIYRPAGHTQRPRGHSDSLPACLAQAPGTCLNLVSGLQQSGSIYTGSFLVLHVAQNGDVTGTGGEFYSEWYDVRGQLTDAGARLESKGESGVWTALPLTWIPALATFSGWTGVTADQMRQYSGGGVPLRGEPCG